MTGWTIATVEGVDADSPLLDTAEAQFDRVTEWDDQIEIMTWGYGQHTAVLSALESHSDEWTDAVLMDCNDTSDSGEGTAYQSDDGVVSSIDKTHGATGAMGRDAAQNLRHTLSGRVRMR